jgi:Zn-dependent membrane protease YugP
MTRRRVVRRLWLWSGLFVVALTVGFVLTGLDAAGAGAAVLVLSVLFYFGAVYACRGALSRLARARSVLETHPVSEGQTAKADHKSVLAAAAARRG